MFNFNLDGFIVEILSYRKKKMNFILVSVLARDWALLRDLHWTCNTNGSNLNTESPLRSLRLAICKEFRHDKNVP